MDFLRETVRRFYYVPPYALWRAVELRLFSEERFEKPILDLGCGDGTFALILFGKGGVDAGIDSDPLVVEKALRTGVYDNAETMDACHMDFPDNCFKTVISNCVLEHIPDLQGVLSECFRVLDHGGSFILTVPSEKFHDYLYHYKRYMKDGLPGKASEYLQQIDSKHKHLRYLTPDEWRDALTETGFSRIDMKYYLSEETVSMWDRLEAFFTSELFSVLRRARFRLLILLLVITPSFALRSFWYRLLRRYYLAEVTGNERGGAIFIRCEID
ncbi:MAG: class I SAM-dependent methyltransferase [Actinomycetia bacterium]|nr:class I SAM-dependent methyltransferase [Actinomycetes bacterium]